MWFGPDIKWGATWATAESWKSPFTIAAWAWSQAGRHASLGPFAGGGTGIVGGGDGRIVFGCLLEQWCVVNESINMGRPDFADGFGLGGYYMFKFGPRIGVYGSDCWWRTTSCR